MEAPAQVFDSSPLTRLRQWLPHGRGLPPEEWRVRHRAVVLFIFAHAAILPFFAIWRGWSPQWAVGEGVLLALLGLASTARIFSRKLRGALAAFGCVMCSAILVQFWGGLIEAHFHFFVVVALISLYQDWVAFLVSIAFVALDHGLVGTLYPQWVFNHDQALANPWGWAIIHATFILAESVALVAVWRANEQARAANDRILRSTGEGLLGVDGECCITFANPAALAMAGLTERDLIGKPLYGMLRGQDDRPAFSPDILKTTPGSFTSQAWLAKPTGERTPIEVLCTPFEGQAHQAGAVVALRDLTERLHAEQERLVVQSQQQELDRLREVDSFKTRFMNMAAHELNTPLTPIKVQMHLLKARADEPALDMHKKAIHLLDRNFQRLAGLVGDLLDSSRLQSDRMPVRPAAIDLAALARDVIESFRPACQAAEIQLQADLPAALPCHADADRLTQAITNLLSNAVKFTPPGGTIRLQGTLVKDRIRIAVTDTGLGLTPDQAARLFRPFEQVHESQVRNKGGSGLGLYITRGIIEMHGGVIGVQSPGPNQGSTFSFEIPIQGPAQAAPSNGEAAQSDGFATAA